MPATRNIMKKGEKCNNLFFICLHRIGLVFGYFDEFITQEKTHMLLNCVYGTVVYILFHVYQKLVKSITFLFCFHFPHDVCKNVRNVITFSNSFKLLLASVWPF